LIWVLYLIEEFVLIKPRSAVSESEPVSRCLEWAAFGYLPAGMAVTLAGIWIRGGGVDFGSATILGILLCIAGLGLRYWSRRELGRFFTIGVVKQEDHRVIQTGPYRIIRHPAYLAFLLFYSGFALIGGHWLGVIFLGVPAAVIFAGLIVVEDAHLASAIGGEYQAYQKKTHRIIPGIW